MIPTVTHIGEHVILNGNKLTPDEARRLSWDLQNAATEVDGLKVTQVSREHLPPRGVLLLPFVGDMGERLKRI